MAMKLFKAPALPKPPDTYDPNHVKQLLRIISIYFSQLDSFTPQQAESYTAQFFYGVMVATNYTTAEKAALTPAKGWVVYDTTLNKLCVYTGSSWETITSV